MVAPAVWTTRDDVDSDNELLQLLHSLRDGGPGKQQVLWIFADADARRRVKGKPVSKMVAGELLGYPLCCVQHSVRSSREMDTRFLNAVTEKVGTDRSRIKKALLEGGTFDFDQTRLGMENIPATTTKTHLSCTYAVMTDVRCDDCLSNPKSPSAQLNARYEALVREVAQLSRGDVGGGEPPFRLRQIGLQRANYREGRTEPPDLFPSGKAAGRHPRASLSVTWLCGHQNTASSGRLDLVVAGMVLVSSLVSIWCPSDPQN